MAATRSGFCTAGNHSACRIPGCPCRCHAEAEIAALRLELEKARIDLAHVPVCAHENAISEPLGPEPGSWDVGGLEGIHKATEALHNSLRIDDLTPVEAIQMAAVIQVITGILKTIEAGLARHAYLTGEHGDQEIDGLGIVAVQRGRDRKAWEGRALIQAVLDAQMDKRGGEAPNDPWEVAEWLLEVLPVSAPRVTPLRALGIQPDEFCESSPGTISLRFKSGLPT